MTRESGIICGHLDKILAGSQITNPRTTRYDNDTTVSRAGKGDIRKRVGNRPTVEVQLAKVLKLA